MLKPLGDRVIVKVVEDEEETVGGIVLANNAKQKPQQGKIVAVGEGGVTPEGKRLPLSVKEGDTILYDKYAGSEVKYEGDDYLVLHEKDIMAIVE
ncbi:MAG: co-chaperone GroES [Lactobacillus sp.]|uniref:Co-chaperonin GroES n=1 Tax=Lacticaseibacillus suilingensis TaxID=2799577 RepID=A0ABW4BI44_9LACO|nr:co-chaperone GroES [Lacticaseibacillus suilingensis]MCI1893712.1 co-chaperone GroES [Lactobacillus sp.]MCI1916739.1 co-chaperone GroES [Lactobacillus sp.]MCI1941347.1 co-chaperone GroES [Lactobacillus sp.]MCI1971891.1 co-chaperone GroES [Lactobacillus sp.]MCI2016601.1 co-chaperone GroES [Lactobacillus sp.]